MKRKNKPQDVTPKQPESKEAFLQELDEAEMKKTNGGMWGTCMNGCGGRCGGCRTEVGSGGMWW